MEISCYSMDLYCDNHTNVIADGVHEYLEFPVTYLGETRGECVKNARKNGWLFRRNGETLCPKCSGKAVRAQETQNEQN